MIPSKPHILLVLLEALPGKEQALKEALQALVTPTRKEEGCVTYRLHLSPTHPARMMFYEIWVDKAAHANHGETTHMQKWRAIKNDLLAKPTEVSVWEEL